MFCDHPAGDSTNRYLLYVAVELQLKDDKIGAAEHQCCGELSIVCNEGLAVVALPPDFPCPDMLSGGFGELIRTPYGMNVSIIYRR